MTGWKREDWFDSTGLPWVNPSPNIRNLDEALLYPGYCHAGIFNELFRGQRDGGAVSSKSARIGSMAASWHAALVCARFRACASPRLNSPPVLEFQRKDDSGGALHRDRPGYLFVLPSRGWPWRRRLASSIPGRCDLEVNRNLIGNGGVMRALADAGTDAGSAADADIVAFLDLREKYLLYTNVVRKQADRAVAATNSDGLSTAARHASAAADEVLDCRSACCGCLVLAARRAAPLFGFHHP